jgi:hypothetical protein
MAANSNGPSVSWSSVVSTGAFLTLLVGGGWTIFQTQFSSMSAQIVENRIAVEKATMLVQSQMDRRFGELEKDSDYLRTNRVATNEFNQFQGNVAGQIETLRRQLAVIEQTRPTTGELQAANKNSQETANRLDDRVRYLEQYLLGQSRIFSSPK